MTASKKAYTAAVLQASIIGLSFLFVKVALAEAGPLDVLAHRFTLSFLAMSLMMLIGHKRPKITWKDIKALLPLALLYPAGFFAFQAFGLFYTSSSEAGIIQASIPVITVILASWFLGETTTLQQKIGILLSASGVAFMFLMKGVSLSQSSLLGGILIFISAMTSAGYNVLARKISKRYSLMEMTYVMLSIGFVVFNVLALTQHAFNHSMDTFLVPYGKPAYLLAIVYLGLCSSLVSALLSNYALSILKASQVSVFMHLATVITLFSGVLFLQETLSASDIGGALLILLGVFGTQIPLFKKRESHAQLKHGKKEGVGIR